MPVSQNLMLALLSMDSYNRGYGERNKVKQRGRFPLDSQFITYEGHQSRSTLLTLSTWDTAHSDTCPKLVGWLLYDGFVEYG